MTLSDPLRTKEDQLRVLVCCYQLHDSAVVVVVVVMVEERKRQHYPDPDVGVGLVDAEWSLLVEEVLAAFFPAADAWPR